MIEPNVSVLIPARNEAKNLHRLFTSLDLLTFPKENLEILLGNDNSDDDTGRLFDEYALNKPWVKVIHIQEDTHNSLKGKTRVLSYLIKESSGKYLLFTDADIAVNPNWIQGMVEAFTSNTGVVVGCTTFNDTTIFQKLQSMEWLSILSLCDWAAKFSIPSTGLGNNMAILRDAYNEVGGYESIPFSIIEDYSLYQAIVSKGYGFKHLMQNNIVAQTLPPERFFEQRNRWIKGALKHDLKASVLGIMLSLLLPIIFVVGLINIYTAALFLISIYIFLCILMMYYQIKLKTTKYLSVFPVFPIYMITAWFLLFLNHLKSKNIIWKGRQYL